MFKKNTRARGLLMIEFKPEHYILEDTKFKSYCKSSRESREELLTQAFDDYLTKVHGLSLQYLLHLHQKHNMKLKHFKVIEYVQENKTCYLFKDKLIFTIHFDNMTWKCDIYY